MIYFLQIWKYDPSKNFYNVTLTLIDLLIQNGLLQLKGICNDLQGSNFNIKQIKLITGDDARVMMEFAYEKIKKGLPLRQEEILFATMTLKNKDMRNLIQDIFNPAIKKVV